jgi:hypothetical protein
VNISEGEVLELFRQLVEIGQSERAICEPRDEDDVTGRLLRANLEDWQGRRVFLVQPNATLEGWETSAGHDGGHAPRV